MEDEEKLRKRTHLLVTSKLTSKRRKLHSVNFHKNKQKHISFQKGRYTLCSVLVQETLE